MPNLDPTPDERIAWLDGLANASEDLSEILVIVAVCVAAVAVVAVGFLFGFGMIG